MGTTEHVLITSLFVKQKQTCNFACTLHLCVCSTAPSTFFCIPAALCAALLSLLAATLLAPVLEGCVNCVYIFFLWGETAAKDLPRHPVYGDRASQVVARSGGGRPARRRATTRPAICAGKRASSERANDSRKGGDRGRRLEMDEKETESDGLNQTDLTRFLTQQQQKAQQSPNLV